MDQLKDKWILWYHSINDNRWGKESYQSIFEINNLFDYQYINDLAENPSSIVCSDNTCSAEECCSSAPVPSNTPFVSAEYVKLREKAREKDGPIVTDKNDTPEGIGPTEPTPSSTEDEFTVKEEVKLTPVES